MKKNVLFFSPTFYDLPLNENIKKKMKKNNFKFIEKKRNEKLPIYKVGKFSKMYNYYFERKKNSYNWRHWISWLSPL